MKFENIIASFKLGEVSDYINYANKDYNYLEASKKIANLLITPYGPLVKRPGSKFLQIIYQGKEIKLIAFEHNNNNILIEIYSKVFKFYLNGISLIKNNTAYTISTPWETVKEVKSLNYVLDEANNIFYFFSASVEPVKIKLDNDYNFTLSYMDFIDGPYQNINKTSTALTLSATSGSNKTLTATADIFSIADTKGTLVRILHKGIWGIAKIVSFINPKTAHVNIIKNFADINASKDFRLSAWNDSQGFPELAVIFNGRLYCAKNKANKKTLWISKLWDYENFAPTTNTIVNEISSDIITDENSITLNIPEGKEILWLSSNKDNVIIGTQEGVFTATSLKADQAIIMALIKLVALKAAIRLSARIF
ncbi:hypothetical protein ABSA28_00965 [Candidatus Hepatincolaceae symbiont of Richtersius coronifer]